MPLSQLPIEVLKPRDIRYAERDGHGLVLEIELDTAIRLELEALGDGS